jgi:micrococcal nuclease
LPNETCCPGIVLESARVTEIIDGDSIEVTIDEQSYQINYIGIRAPEPNVLECFGEEAFQRNSQLVLGQEVGLEKDVSDMDESGRLARYVWVNGDMVNETLAREGYALAEVTRPNTKYSIEFQLAQAKARDDGAGIWTACVH